MATARRAAATSSRDRKSTRLNSSHLRMSYAVFCLKIIMSDGADHVEGGKIGTQIRCAAGPPSRESIGHPGKPAPVLGKASDHYFFERKRRPPKSTLFSNTTPFQ